MPWGAQIVPPSSFLIDVLHVFRDTLRSTRGGPINSLRSTADLEPELAPREAESWEGSQKLSTKNQGRGPINSLRRTARPEPEPEPREAESWEGNRKLRGSAT